MTKDKLLASAEKYHSEAPGCWLQTDRELTNITDVIRDATHVRPTGGIWWRTHQLIATLRNQTAGTDARSFTYQRRIITDAISAIDGLFRDGGVSENGRPGSDLLTAQESLRRALDFVPTSDFIPEVSQ